MPVVRFPRRYLGGSSRGGHGSATGENINPLKYREISVRTRRPIAGRGSGPKPAPTPSPSTLSFRFGVCVDTPVVQRRAVVGELRVAESGGE